MRGKARGAMLTMALLAVALGVARPAPAQDASGGDPAVKLERGLQNGILGWTEIVSRPQAEAQAKGATGVVTGLLDGVAYGTIRTVTGAAEVATFWSPLPVTYQPPIPGPSLGPPDRR